MALWGCVWEDNGIYMDEDEKANIHRSIRPYKPSTRTKKNIIWYFFWSSYNLPLGHTNSLLKLYINVYNMRYMTTKTEWRNEISLQTLSTVLFYQILRNWQDQTLEPWKQVAEDNTSPINRFLLRMQLYLRFHTNTNSFLVN